MYYYILEIYQQDCLKFSFKYDILKKHEIYLRSLRQNRIVKTLTLQVSKAL